MKGVNFWRTPETSDVKVGRSENQHGFSSYWFQLVFIGSNLCFVLGFFLPYFAFIFPSQLPVLWISNPSIRYKGNRLTETAELIVPTNGNYGVQIHATKKFFSGWIMIETTGIPTVWKPPTANALILWWCLLKHYCVIIESTTFRDSHTNIWSFLCHVLGVKSGTSHISFL